MAYTLVFFPIFMIKVVYYTDRLGKESKSFQANTKKRDNYKHVF